RRISRASSREIPSACPNAPRRRAPRSSPCPCRLAADADGIERYKRRRAQTTQDGAQAAEMFDDSKCFSRTAGLAVAARTSSLAGTRRRDRAVIRNVSLPGMRIEASALGFGCASLGSRVSASHGLSALARAHEAGINWFDIAPAYGAGEAEAIFSR